LRGWTKDGIPSADELDRLDLGFVKNELKQRNIL
jgi:hypothetical protein